MTPNVLNAVFEALPDPCLVVRSDSALSGRRVVLANPAARQMFPITETAPMVASVIRRPELLDIVEEALREGSGGEVEWETGAPLERSLRALVRPLPREQDGSRMAMVIVRDETDARRNERMRADFLANASHELKTPLASLQGFIETLTGHAKDDPAAREKFLGVMAVQVERMIRLVADLLSLSRVELNEHIPPSGKADLAACAHDIADSLQPIAAAGKVALEIAAEGPASVAGDQMQVLQVIQNLVENAIKHSPPSGVVRIEVLRDRSQAALTTPLGARAAYRSLLSPQAPSGGLYTAIRVTNAGPGIVREYLPRLTERFYRAPGQKSGESSGTGLGLAIVKHILNRHRGGLFVESAEGEGAVFTAYFPQEAPCDPATS